METEDVHLKLVRKAMRGNTDAYGQLIAEYQEYLYKMAFLYMKNQEEALDVVGTAVLKGYQHIKTLKNPKWFKTWLTRIVINTANDTLKKIVYYSELDDIQLSERHKGVSLEESWDLKDAVSQLPERYRSVIILKYYSGMTIDEISYIMNAPTGTVKSYLCRAKEDLKKYLREDYMYADHI